MINIGNTPIGLVSYGNQPIYAIMNGNTVLYPVNGSFHTQLVGTIDFVPIRFYNTTTGSYNIFNGPRFVNAVVSNVNTNVVIKSYASSNTSPVIYQSERFKPITSQYFKSYSIFNISNPTSTSGLFRCGFMVGYDASTYSYYNSRFVSTQTTIPPYSTNDYVIIHSSPYAVATNEYMYPVLLEYGASNPFPSNIVINKYSYSIN